MTSDPQIPQMAKIDLKGRGPVISIVPSRIEAARKGENPTVVRHVPSGWSLATGLEDDTPEASVAWDAVQLATLTTSRPETPAGIGTAFRTRTGRELALAKLAGR